MTAPPEDTAGPGPAGAASLPEAVRLGDAAAEDQLAARFRPGLVTMLRFRTRDPEVAQELVPGRDPQVR